LNTLELGCRTLAVFKGAGFLPLHLLFSLADSDPSFLRLRRVAGRKTRTLHKNREECGTRFWEWTSLHEGNLSDYRQSLR
jgi:hypothetical protein